MLTERLLHRLRLCSSLAPVRLRSTSFAPPPPRLCSVIRHVATVPSAHHVRRICCRSAWRRRRIRHGRFLASYERRRQQQEGTSLNDWNELTTIEARQTLFTTAIRLSNLTFHISSSSPPYFARRRERANSRFPRTFSLSSRFVAVT